MNGVRPRMRQMDVWSRDHRRPIEQEEKDRVAAGWYTSPDSEPRVRSAPAGDVPPTSRRVAHSRNVPRFRSLRERREGGREVQQWLNTWRLWEISVFPLTVLIMDVPLLQTGVFQNRSYSVTRFSHSFLHHTRGQSWRAYEIFPDGCCCWQRV